MPGTTKKTIYISKYLLSHHHCDKSLSKQHGIEQNSRAGSTCLTESKEGILSLREKPTKECPEIKGPDEYLGFKVYTTS